MYQLPDVLIDYIFSFDSNDYHKKNFNAVVKELNFWYSRERTIKFLDCKYSIYNIYSDYHIGWWKNSLLTLPQYILQISKEYSHDVHVSSIKYKLRYNKKGMKYVM